MPGHGEKPESTRAAAIAALLTEGTLAAAAEKAGVGITTLRGWLRQPKFLAAYRAARRAVVEHAVARLQWATDKAVEALERNLAAAKPADQIRASALILEHALRGLEVMDLAQQVAEIRQQIEEAKNHAGGGTTAGSLPAEGQMGGADGGESTAAANQGGPDSSHDGGWDGPRPVAGTIAPLPAPEDVAPL